MPERGHLCHFLRCCEQGGCLIGNATGAGRSAGTMPRLADAPPGRLKSAATSPASDSRR